MKTGLEHDQVTDKAAKPPADTGAPSAPTPGKQRAIRLKSMDDVRMEMARVYSDARRNVLAPEAASKLVYILSQVGRVIEGSELVKRMAEIEKRQAEIEGRV